MGFPRGKEKVKQPNYAVRSSDLELLGSHMLLGGCEPCVSHTCLSMCRRA